MKKKISKDIQPATALWSIYNPSEAPFAFRTNEFKSAREWQTGTRRALAQKIGLGKIPSSDPHAVLVEEKDKGDYIRRKIIVRTGPKSLMPVYILLPKNRPIPLPVVLAFHGHGYGVKDIVGLYEDGSERDTPQGYQKDFAVALCRSGFAVAAPEISCFGERQTDFSYLNSRLEQPIPTTCAHTAMLAFHLGISVVGLRVHDSMCLIDYLQTRKEFDIKRLGAMGISGGGMTTFFSTCIDSRIKACVISGYFSTFKDSIFAMSHCACNFVPGLAEFGEMYDLVGLIAPRPMLIEAGKLDPIYPITAVKRGVRKAKGVYKVFDSIDLIQTDFFEGTHEINGKLAYRFLEKTLK